MAVRANCTLTATRIDSGRPGFLKYTSLPPGDVLAADIMYPTNVCSIACGFNTVASSGTTCVPYPRGATNAGEQHGRIIILAGFEMRSQRSQFIRL
jgi:hypothetical protein